MVKKRGKQLGKLPLIVLVVVLVLFLGGLSLQFFKNNDSVSGLAVNNILKADNEPCTLSRECRSNNCLRGYCVPRGKTKTDGTCITNSDCVWTNADFYLAENRRDWTPRWDYLTNATYVCATSKCMPNNFSGKGSAFPRECSGPEETNRARRDSVTLTENPFWESEEMILEDRCIGKNNQLLEYYCTAGHLAKVKTTTCFGGEACRNGACWSQLAQLAPQKNKVTDAPKQSSFTLTQRFVSLFRR